MATTKTSTTLYIETAKGVNVEVSEIDKDGDIEIFLGFDSTYISKDDAKELIAFLTKQVEK